MKRLDFSTALDRIAAAALRLEAEIVPIEQAAGRILAAEIAAQCDYPAFDCAAMDGAAVIASRTAQASPGAPVRLPITGEIRASSRPQAAAAVNAAHGCCMISTGAAVVAPFDAVAAREYIAREGNDVVLRAPIDVGRNVRRRGEDARAGELVARPGQIVTPWGVGALCCYGIDVVEVVRRPRAIVLPTGDELRSSNATGAFAVHDSNGPMIAAMLRHLGIDVELASPVIDEHEGLLKRIREAGDRSPDLIISTGGVSVGEHDHVASALEKLHANFHFHGVSMRPGKPALFATLGDGTLYFGLPGNPVAAAVGARFFVTTAVRAMLGLNREVGTTVSVDVPGIAPAGVTRILKARRSADNHGAVELAQDQRSHTMRPLLECDTWLVVKDGPEGNAREYFTMTPSLF